MPARCPAEAPTHLTVFYKTGDPPPVKTINSGFEGAITAFGAVPGETPTLIAAVVRYSNVLKTQGDTQIIITLPTD